MRFRRRVAARDAEPIMDGPNPMSTLGHASQQGEGQRRAVSPGVTRDA